MIFLRSSIGKFGSSLALKRGQDKSCRTFQKYYLSRPFPCSSAISFLLGVTGNTDAYVWRSIEHISIVLQDWTLLGTPIKVYEFVLSCIC